MAKNLFPTHIKTIAITAPAGRPDAEKLAKATTFLQSAGYQIRDFMPQANGNTPKYLAAGADERIAALNAAIQDPATDLILCARGGFGSMHLLDSIDYKTLKQRNLPIMGYSDITALHCAMLTQNSGIPVAGCNLLDLPQVADDDFTIASHLAALDNQVTPITLPEAPQKLQTLPSRVAIKSVQAPAYAANLTVLASLCGSKYLPEFRNMILIIEDVNEPPYKIDRMLNQLAMNCIFDRLAALVFGTFSTSDQPEEIDYLLQTFAGRLNIPVFRNFQFGHCYPMCAVNARKNLLVTDGKPVTVINL